MVGKTKNWLMWPPYWVFKLCFLNFPSIFVLLWWRCRCERYLLLYLIVISHSILSLATVLCNAWIFYMFSSLVLLCKMWKLDIDACSLLWRTNKLHFCLFFDCGYRNVVTSEMSKSRQEYYIEQNLVMWKLKENRFDDVCTMKISLQRIWKNILYMYVEL